jgi:hypothetical protein
VHPGSTDLPGPRGLQLLAERATGIEPAFPAWEVEPGDLADQHRSANVQVDRFLVRPCLPGLPSLCSVMARIWHALARMPPPRLEGEGYAAPVARVLNQIGQRLTTRPQHRPRRRGQGRARATPTPKARLLTIVLVSSNGTSATRLVAAPARSEARVLGHLAAVAAHP